MSKKNPRKKRPNPAFGMLPGIEKLVAESAGSMAVNHALAGATLDERLLISAMIPTMLAFIRKGSQKSVSEIVDTLYAGGVDIEVQPGIRVQREPKKTEA